MLYMHIITLNSQLSILNFQLSILNFQLSILNLQLSILNLQLSILNSQLSTINFQLSPHRFLYHLRYFLSIALVIKQAFGYFPSSLSHSSRLFGMRSDVIYGTLPTLHITIFY